MPRASGRSESSLSTLRVAPTLEEFVSDPHYPRVFTDCTFELFLSPDDGHQLNSLILGIKLIRVGRMLMLEQICCPYCASAQQVVYVHGHKQCVKCGINVSPCCSGEQMTEY